MVLLQRSRKLTKFITSIFITILLNHIQKTLFIFCAGNELFFVALYLMKWDHTPTGISFLGGLTWAQILAFVTLPLCFTKNFVFNVVQLWKASKILVGIDLAERAKEREEAEIRRARAAEKE